MGKLRLCEGAQEKVSGRQWWAGKLDPWGKVYDIFIGAYKTYTILI